MEHLLFGIPVGIVVLLIPCLALFGALMNGTIALLCARLHLPTPKALVSLVGILMPLLAFGLSLWLFFFGNDPATGFTTRPLWDWISVGDFKAGLSFKVDRLSLLMSLVVTGVGSLIHIYSIGYMAHDEGYARYFSYLNLFLFAMLILVLGGSLPLLFVGWEGVGLCSYLLIGFWFEDPAKASAGKKAFIVNRIGDAGFLLAMFLLYKHLSLKGADPTGGLLSFEVLEKYQGDLALIATPVCLFLLLGVVGKSAQIPLYIWLPDAMAGPTPVSALIHAATMVTAGVYLIARLHFLYVLSPTAMQVVATLGMTTAFFAATIAFVQRDIKKVLAYSTVSQLGFMIFAVGVGAFSAGIFHLMTHAFFKACLFLGAGSVIHALGGEQDIWKMGGLKQRMPVTYWTFAISVLAISGIFPFAGFFSKDAILWQGFATGHRTLWALGLVTAGMTTFYMTRLVALVFLGNPREKEIYRHAHESPWVMTGPLVVLAFLALVGGWVGIPESLKGGDLFYHWFAPIFAHEEFFQKIESVGHGVELLLSIGTLLWVFHVGLFALVLYSQKLNLVQKLREKMPTFHRILEGKYYVDELYQFCLIRPLRWISEKVLWKFMDKKVIDSLFVEGTAETVGLFGRTMAMLETGLVQNYLLFFAIGGTLLVAYFIL